jgi:3-oxoacyl-[acyl-carrier protein] reductase
MRKTAIITGAGKGIGRATAVELARRGYRLALLARTEADLLETARLAGATDAVIASADVGKRESLVAGMERAVRELGHVDALVNNAGLAPLAAYESFSHEALDEVVRVNLTAVAQGCRVVWPGMKERGGGVIVNVGSIAGIDPFEGLAVYAAAKAGVAMLSQALNAEGGKHGIRVICVAPGAVETGMLRELFDADTLPASATLRPEEVAAVIADAVTGVLVHAGVRPIYLSK